MTVPAGWRPTFPDSVPQELKDAVRIIYEQHDQLKSDVGSAIAKVGQKVQSASDLAKQSASSTESLLTTLPDYALLQAGSSSQLRQGQGSVLPISSGSLLYDNSVAGVVKWYFTGLTITWPDGSSTPLPDTTVALPSISVSGLAPGSYLFYPRYNIARATVQWVQVVGGTGTPPAAYATSSVLAGQAQNADGMVALSLGGITGVATGGGGGGGSGGGRRGFGAQ
jgi:hypothetical protein